MAASLFFQIVLGWPSIVCGLVLMTWAVLARKDKLGLAGAIVSSGFCLYLTGANWLLGPLVYACNWGSYYFLRKRNVRTSALLIAPFALIAAWFAVAVIVQ